MNLLSLSSQSLFHVYLDIISSSLDYLLSLPFFYIKLPQEVFLTKGKRYLAVRVVYDLGKSIASWLLPLPCQSHLKNLGFETG